MSDYPRFAEIIVENTDAVDSAQFAQNAANFAKDTMLGLGYANGPTGRIHEASLRGRWYIPNFIKKRFGVNGPGDMIIDVVPSKTLTHPEGALIEGAIRPQPWIKSVIEEIETAVLRR